MQSDDAPKKASTPDPESILGPATPERRSLLSRFGGPSNPARVVSKPTGPIMADPAWVFEERPAAAPGTAAQYPLAEDGEPPRQSALGEQARSSAISALVAEVEAARSQNAPQTAQEPPGDSPSHEGQHD